MQQEEEEKSGERKGEVINLKGGINSWRERRR